MVFSSPIFLGLFLPVVLGVYFFANMSIRNLILLVASLFFYAWGEPQAVWVMIGLSVLSYALALWIDRASGKPRVILLGLGVALNLSALVYYKYLMLFASTLLPMARWIGIDYQVPHVALPIGISFYVFQILSYLVDVFRKDVPAQNNLFSFMMYVSLFPQLIAGPIVRYSAIVGAIANRSVNFANIVSGAQRFIIGLAKKVLIADSMATIADAVFKGSPEMVPGVYCWVGAFAYALQIFYDFSGYSDMAIGLGRIFNFKFLENFDHPYSACSIQEFWRRWHISLSTWFRDYLYIPLGGNRRGRIRTYVNMFVVFFLCGLWHGASWNFAFWGIYHGLGLIAERVGVSKVINRLPKAFANVYVWLFVVVGWVFFRADSLSNACVMLRNMFLGNWAIKNTEFIAVLDFFSYANIELMVVGFLLSYPIFGKCDWRLPLPVRYVGYLLLAAVSLCVAMTSGYSPFIYFRF